jgi:glycosyltransferase involved in cell wall biosynthesis
MRALIFPSDGPKIDNPYCDLLYRNMEKLGVAPVAFTPLRAIAGRYEIFHLHWPEYYLSQRFLKAFVGSAGLLLLVQWLRLRGTRIVWTAHNLHSHGRFYPKVEPWFWWGFTRMLDGFIALSDASVSRARGEFPGLRSVPSSVIPHGDYRDCYPATITKADARRQLGIPADGNVLLFFGGINAYKNVPHLAKTFRRAALDHATLVIAGSASSREDEERLRDAVKGSHNIQLHLRRIPKEEVQVFFAATDLVVLPFLEIMNSGSAILALSFDRPVLVPARGSLPELQKRVGLDWVSTYTGDLGVAELAAGLAWSRSTHRDHSPNLKDFDWGRIARETLYVYTQLIDRVSATACASSAAGSDGT